jgi:hypothetical protein
VVINPIFGPEGVVNNSPTVMTNSPSVYLIFWGANWANNPADVTFKNNIIAGYQSIVSSSFLQVTKEYGTTGSAVFGASYVDSASSPPVGYDDSGATSGAKGQAGMQAEIANVITTAGSGIPAPAGNNILTAPIYIVFAQPDASAGAGSSSTNGGYNVPGTFSGKAINMIAVGTSGSTLDFVTGTGSHELAERITDPKEDGSGALFSPPTLPAPPPPEFPSGPGNYQVGDGEAEAQTYNYRLGSANGPAVQFIYSAATKSLGGVAGTWVITDGNSQTIYLTPNWSNGTNVGSSFNGNWNMTINGDQLAGKDDSITLQGTSPSFGGTGLEVKLNGETYFFDPGVINQITIDGKTGSNTLTLDLGSGLAIPTGGISFNGGTGSNNTLAIVGGLGALVHITGTNSGDVTSPSVVSFTNVQHLKGGTGNETFQFSVAGSVSSIDGGGGNDTIVGANQTNTWNITGANAGNLTGSVAAFTNIENLTGGTGQDTFTFAVGGSLTGNIDGGGGNDTIVGANQTDNWSITGANAGSITAVLAGFTNIDNLTGGTVADTFTFAVGGSLAGTIDGGGGAALIVGANQTNNWNINGANAGKITGALNAFVNVQSLTGGTGQDTFTFLVGGSLTGAINGGGGNDTIVGANQANTWNITGVNAGNLPGVLPAFTNVENLTGGTGQDVFAFKTGGKETGHIDGGAGSNWLVYSAITQFVIVNLKNGTASLATGGVSNIHNVIGSANGGDTITGDSTGGVLEGHNAGNTITGGSGRSVLIGGYGKNLVQGAAADDIVIGGKTSFDAKITALIAILAEWQSAASFGTRVNQLRAGVLDGNGQLDKLVLNSTVFCTGTPPGPRFGRGGGNGQSTLFGGGGQNWFFTLYPSEIVDLTNNDIVN